MGCRDCRSKLCNNFNKNAIRFSVIQAMARANCFPAERIRVYWVEVLQIIIMHQFKIKASIFIAGIALAVFSIIANPTINTSARLSPGPNDGRIAYVTARLLEEFHYSQAPFDAEMSGKFFDGYLESLDPRHEDFLQSDIAGFMHYRTNLDQLTIGGGESADLTPAYEIFQRFLERFQQRTAYVDELLKENKFQFTGDDRIFIDRRHAPYPKNLAEAQQLWREQLRYEYLQEKLSR